MHPLPLRLIHWLNAAALACMTMSGWLIYNASPLFAFRFPPWATLGGWLGGALAWHFAAMWFLAANALLYAAWRSISRHRPDRTRLQRTAYRVVFLLLVIALASGLGLWKPVQLQALTTLFGGYVLARRVHFAAMAGILAFALGHIALALTKPRLILQMVIGP